MIIKAFYKYLFILLFTIGFTSVQAQEFVMPLQRNALLDPYMPAQKNTFGSQREKHGVPHTQQLPFFDDFSRSGLYPNDTLWLNNYVYINKTFGINPPSTGVATFEGLDANGKAYTAGDQSTSSATTDTLTSTYIDLSPYADADSLYLSFYYQPQGFGTAEQRLTDSFILQFHPDSLLRKNKWDDSAWVTVWATPGIPGGQDFRQVMIPIRKLSSPNYFHNKFQFRFYAYGHRSGNLDQWHLDYVYVNRGRTKTKFENHDADITVEDVAISKPSGSILNKYYAMPVKQFLAGVANGNNPLASSVRVNISNNSISFPEKNVTFGYTVTNVETGQENSFSNSGVNVKALSQQTFELSNKAEPSLVSGTKTTLLVKTFAKNIPDNFGQNDTATHKQVFADYLAYDDGTAEGGYGLRGTNIGKVAVKFTLNTPDTLYGIAVHFNQANQYVGARSVNFGVWHKLTAVGAPEKDEFVEKISYVRPEYDGINGFTYFL
ncbi:MAG: hypothetical protein EOP53_14815 [Sphingobacteriales bacterium]|nr:MAG: hypothetical protein EOP53_14815 [Sphingobacteriales bacterium]